MEGSSISKFSGIKEELLKKPKVWCITGVAGFIGSNLLHQLLILNQRVVGIDNFETGYRRNLEQVRDLVTVEQWSKFIFHEGDICDPIDCAGMMYWQSGPTLSKTKVDYVLHQAALGSVPRSIGNPLHTNNANVTGFVNVIDAARKNHVKRFVYAASSSTYGDHPALPKVEEQIGQPLSPYAVTKLVNEIYADVYARCYGLQCIGLRYFNVFGPRQDPAGAYAAVVPKWLACLTNNETVEVNGDGETSRDFCFIDNAVQANILAATAKNEAVNQVFNVAVGARTSLNELCEILRSELEICGHVSKSNLKHFDFRAGDVRHSQADISKAIDLLCYQPTHTVKKGISELVRWSLQLTSHNFKDGP